MKKVRNKWKLENTGAKRKMRGKRKTEEEGAP